MKPINYKLEDNIATFIYDEAELKRFHELGKEHGDVGGTLTKIDYNTKLFSYDWYGTIEAPCKKLRVIDIEHDPILDGELSTPEEIINPPQEDKTITHNYSFIIWDASKE